MKFVLIALFMLLSLWSIFSFDLEKPLIAFRYGISFIIVYPFRFIFLLAFLGSVGFIFWTVYMPHFQVITQTYTQAEQLLSNGERAGIKVKNIKGTLSYMRINNILNEPIRTDSTFEATLQDFITKQRALWDELPAAFRDPANNTGLISLPKPLQISYVKVEAWRHTILFLYSDENLLDKRILHEHGDFSLAPSVQQLQFHAPKVPVATIEQVITAFTNWQTQAMSLYDPHTDFGFIGDPTPQHKFLVLFIPEPADRYDYNNILKGLVGFRYDH
jgi:hypothetical protein